MKRPCILVPYRNREEHLKQFVPHIKQIIPEADIYIIHQADHKPFNRGKLINVGYLLTKGKYDYYITHDIDMLAEENNYKYPEDCVYHIATNCQQFEYKMPYPDYFGGVNIFNPNHFEQIGGFSNEFWGWGAEDDEIFREVNNHNISIERINTRFKSLDHLRRVDIPAYNKNLSILNKGTRSNNDGLRFCYYNVLFTEDRKDYKFISVII